MATQIESNSDHVFAVGVNDKWEQQFLHHLADEDGLEAWVKPNSHTRVYVRTTRERVDALLSKAKIGFMVLSFRRHGIVAEAMLYAGSQKATWPQIISQAEARMSLLVKNNEHLRPASDAAQKAKAEISPMMRHAAELSLTLGKALQDFDVGRS